MKRSLRVIFTLLFLVFFLWKGVEAADKCAMCGMALAEHVHTRYTLIMKDGSKEATCGVQCGLMLEMNLKDKVASAQATDFISGKPIDSRAACYVYGSEAVPDMPPGFIAFARRSDADKFQKGFGGRVVTFEEAMELLTKKEPKMKMHEHKGMKGH